MNFATGLKDTLKCVDTAWTESTKVFYVTMCDEGTGYSSANPTEPNPTEPSKPADPQSPQTGDNSMMGLWIALLFVSGFGVVTTTVYGKKRKSVK